MKSIFFFLLFCISFPLLSQVNTEAFRNKNNQKGFSGRFGISTQFNSGNSEFSNIGFSLRSDYINDFNNTFFVSNYERVTGNNELVSNRGFTHVRSSFPLTSFFDAEVFIQKEFNNFILLNDRNLYGVSGRFCVLNHSTDSISIVENTFSKVNFYLGNSFFYEREVLDLENDTTTKIFRSSVNITSVVQLKEYIQLTFASYLQFDVNRVSDHRILVNSTLSIKIFSNLSFLVGVIYRYDSEPPSILLRPFDLSLTNGLSYNF